jgi:hypothetical protein
MNVFHFFLIYINKINQVSFPFFKKKPYSNNSPESLNWILAGLLAHDGIHLPSKLNSGLKLITTTNFLAKLTVAATGLSRFPFLGYTSINKNRQRKVN